MVVGLYEATTFHIFTFATKERNLGMAKKQSRDDTRLPDDSWTTEELEQYVL